MSIHDERLRYFPGGIKLVEHKECSNHTPIGKGPVSSRVFLPLLQHIGTPATPIVKTGQHVLKGQVIAEPAERISAPVHASTSGTVSFIGDIAVPHASGMNTPGIVIDSDGRDEWAASLNGTEDYLNLAPERIREHIRQAGIVGLGGAVFPTGAKLNPNLATIDTLLINGAECEPYITCDDVLMRERADAIVEGSRIIMRAMDIQRCVIGTEETQTQAYDALLGALNSHPEEKRIKLARVPTIYPAGGERQLIKVIFDREVPSRGLPMDVGMICLNVGTAAAVYQAIRHGEPLVSRVVTVTGTGVKQPANLETNLGTPFADLAQACGGYTNSAERLIMGGPMMGFAVSTDTVPVIKATNCVLVAAVEDLPPPAQVMPCIRCGDCATACPAELLPQQLYWYTRSREFDKVEDHNLWDCIECGCCAYVCPSEIPLIDYFRFAKATIKTGNTEKNKSNKARERFDERNERLERIKAMRTERLNRKKAAIKNGI